MTKIQLKEISEYVILYRDSETGIAWVENGHTGNKHSSHANIDETGSVAGMKALGYWKREDRTAQSDGFIYNIDRLVVVDKYDEIARQHCQCGGKH
ncbi:MAG: hypothetical protein WBB28_01890 [Crinalium sp.]